MGNAISDPRAALLERSQQSRLVALMIERAHYDSAGEATAEGAEKIAEAP